ncbi:Mov34/MPN/PAD-1 family protein [Kitasatospora sp. NPDC057965]|uniref:Mov34/MPN/PAD-1 family protein n=1 Tax=Kitasatospora sp. NPDC057965 TaxID=3346291 RepID=UPI0036DD6AE6
MSVDESGFTISPVRRELPQDNPPPLARFLEAGPGLRLVVRERMLNGIRMQAGASPTKEIGGVLVGRHYRTGDRYLVEVDDYVAMPSRDSSASHFEFDQRSIRAIFERLEKRPDQYVVGWYHSHTFGDPFMSDLDHRLHQDHFPEPWYVSCVASIGSRGRSAGFWRMRGAELVEISDYELAVATGGDPASAQKRYLASCGLREQQDGPPALADLLPLLGMPADGAVARLFHELAEDRAEESGLATVRFLVRAAKAVSADPRAVTDLEEFERRLARFRRPSDVLTPLARAPGLRGLISIGGTDYCAYSLDKHKLQRLDLTSLFTFSVRAESPPVCVAHAPDGHVWVLTGSGLIRFPVIDTAALRKGDLSFEVSGADLPDTDGAPEQIVAVEGGLWLRSATTWYRYECTAGSEGKILLAARASGPLPGRGSVFVGDNGLGGPLAPPVLLANEEGTLRTWKAVEDGWAPSAAAELPRPWNGKPVVQAAVSGLGWHVLFDDGGARELCLFDLHTLELVHHVVCEDEEDRITGLSGDGSGKVYLQTEGVLHRG